MPQTFYIEVDEEIISVIGRLRKSSAQENYFVFPKRALVLQSIVNLRLFQREAQKLGKKVIIVSKDENGRMLAEKAGLATEQYSEDFSKQSGEHIELSVAQPVHRVSTNEISSPQKSSIQNTPLRADMIGSSDFYTTDQSTTTSETLTQQPENTGQILRIRNASPERFASLNSKRFAEQETALRKTNNAPAYTPPQKPSPQPLSPIRQKPTEPIPSPAPDYRGERLRNFFAQQTVTPVSSERSSEPSAISGKKAHFAFFILGGISLLSLIGVGMLLFLPKATVHVVPHQIEQTADFTFIGKVNNAAETENAVLVRLLEREQEVHFSTTATGTSTASSGKARGSVIIYNEYSSEPQTLVATTRLETTDGKIFRLTEGVVVPGMTDIGGKKEPGAVEVSVIADQSGETYNIGPSTFTIPGFKSGPKFEKFFAKSTKTMTGGGSDSTEISVITKADREKVEKDAKEEAKKAFIQSVTAELAPDEKIAEDNIEITPLAVASLPQVGTTAASFDYQNTYRIRAFVFSEKTLREKIESLSHEERQGVLFRPSSIILTYGESLPNYTDEIIEMKVHAAVTFDAVIDQDQLRNALLGQNKDGIEQALSTFPAIKKIEVAFHPEWFVTNIPKNQNRITITIGAGEN